MSTHDCQGFNGHLTAALLDGVAPPPELVADARSCPVCRVVLQDIARAIAPARVSEPGPQVADRAISEGGRWARRVYAIGKLINVSVSVLLVTLWIVFVELSYRMNVGFEMPSPGHAARAITVIGTVTVIGWLALRGRVVGGRREVLYSRWPRRQLQGLCSGIAEFFRAPLWLVRALFVALFVGGLGGGTIYFLLSFLVSWHPDDRRHLAWFRIQRWWRRRRGLTGAA